MKTSLVKQSSALVAHSDQKDVMNHETDAKQIITQVSWPNEHRRQKLTKTTLTLRVLYCVQLLCAPTDTHGRRVYCSASGCKVFG